MELLTVRITLMRCTVPIPAWQMSSNAEMGQIGEGVEDAFQELTCVTENKIAQVFLSVISSAILETTLQPCGLLISD